MCKLKEQVDLLTILQNKTLVNMDSLEEVLVELEDLAVMQVISIMPKMKQQEDKASIIGTLLKKKKMGYLINNQH